MVAIVKVNKSLMIQIETENPLVTNLLVVN